MIIKTPTGQYGLDNFLVKKLDLMIDRSTGKNNLDNWILVDGDEGFGKTTLSCLMAYYVSQKTGRQFDASCVFYDVEKMIDIAKKTKDRIFIWDEAALAGLSSEWQNKAQKRLLKLSMVIRKRRHFFVLNIPKFFKLNEYLVVDRSICLIHVYARDQMKPGAFAYYTKRAKEALFYKWKRTKARAYREYITFRGSFPDAMAQVVDEDALDKMKDQAIELFDMASPSQDKTKQELHDLKIKVAKLSGIQQKEKAKQLGIHPRTLGKWASLGKPAAGGSN